MLQKRIDLGSQPFGLAKAGEDIIKGSAVVVKYTGNPLAPNGLEAFYPTTEDEANNVKGFATFRIEEEWGNDSDFDVIKAGGWIVIYTLVKDNMWGTTQLADDTYADGDALVVGYETADKGMLRKPKVTGEETREAQFELFNADEAETIYADAIYDVIVK